MSKKYIYDDKGMDVRKSEGTSALGIFLKILKFATISLTSTIVCYAVFSLVFSTDTERRLKRENRMYGKLYGEMERKDRLLADVVTSLQIRDDEIYRDVFHTSAPDVDMLSAVDLLSITDTLTDLDISVLSGEKLKVLEKCSETVERNFERIFARLSEEDFIMPPMESPLRNFSFVNTGASVGKKISPFYKVDVEHRGLDMIAQSGTPVYASCEGVVSDVIRSGMGHGNVVEITHKGGYVTRYAHLGEIKISRGRSVTPDTQIGTVGMSGTTFAPHLHYEVLRDGKVMDPVNYFFRVAGPFEYADIVVMSTSIGQSMD